MTGAIKSMGSRMANCRKQNENNQFNPIHPLHGYHFPFPGFSGNLNGFYFRFYLIWMIKRFPIASLSAYKL